MEQKPFGNSYATLLIGSQDLYGKKALQQVAENGNKVARGLDESSYIPIRIRLGGVMTTRDEIEAAITGINVDPECVGVIVWCHTFSPAENWVEALSRLLKKPLLHLHTQFFAEIPPGIDMAYMNLHQAAHGDREFAHMLTRADISRHTVVGHWQDRLLQVEIGSWARLAAAVVASRKFVIGMLGGKMRNVMVTGGDPQALAVKLGCRVLDFGANDLLAHMNRKRGAAKGVMEEWRERYAFPERPDAAFLEAVRYQAWIEAGLQSFCSANGLHGFTTTFQDLAVSQLPALAVQSMMSRGFGFGAEGDFRTAFLLALMKYASIGRAGGSSFMEAYTYDYVLMLVLCAHMAEVCPSLAAKQPSVEVHPLSIGGKNPPARLVFNVARGPGVDVCLVDMGKGDYVIIANAMDVKTPGPALEMPKLPVARGLMQPRPKFETAIKAWLEAGGSHHTVLTQALSLEEIKMLAKMLGVRFVGIE